MQVLQYFWFLGCEVGLFVWIFYQVVEFPILFAFLFYDFVSLGYPCVPSGCVEAYGFCAGIGFAVEEGEEAYSVVGSVFGEGEVEGV